MANLSLLVSIGGCVALVGCSADDSATSPTPFDAGGDGAVVSDGGRVGDGTADAGYVTDGPMGGDAVDGSTPPPVFVTCTTTTANLTQSTVQTAVDNAADGDVVCLPAGSAMWGSSIALHNSKGVTLAGAAARQDAGTTTITVGSSFVIGMNGTLSGNNTRAYRITGLTFSGGGSGFVTWFWGPGTLNDIRIDHNTFSEPVADSILIFFGESTTVGYFYGLVDHNTVTASSSVAIAEIIGGADTSTAPSGTRGTLRNLVYEDNTITIARQTNPGRGCVDSWGGPSWVWRHNTTTNCLVTSHGVPHVWGPVNVEVYGNHFIVNAGADPGFTNCYRCFHHQGSGEFIAFDNVFTASSGKSDSAISMTHYRSATPAAAGYGDPPGRCDGTSSSDGNRPGQRGYPCKRQPGRDPSGALQPMYVWNNRWSDTGALITMNVENPWGATNPSVADHVAANRDYYNSASASAQTSPTSPFNGTTGMGFGTLANRPTACTTNSSETGGGVGYFAIDQGPQGTLYRCSATNTWTVHYTPYSYPHP